MKKILVTGGAGFVGSHLCDRLIERGDSVVCVDNFFTGQRKNIEHLLDHENFTLIEHDIVQPLEGVDVDQIYNLACPASPIHYQYNPIKTVKTSTIGMINMLGLAKRTKARILQASTSEVYGDPEVHPQPESYRGNVNTVGIRSCYDEGKRISETLCMDYHREHNLEVRIIRIFNTYGPRMHPQDGRVISNFITQAISNNPITIYGDGTQTRSFCYVDDLVEGIIRMMDQDIHSGPINLGNPTERTMNDMAALIKDMTKSSSDIEHKPLPEDDPQQRQPDISLAKQVLNWEPAVSLEDGLTKTIDYFRSIATDKN
ncbi:MAG: UDP-glucuronic acid decarboxylase family protein [Candidatus Andersenbacteria bacterium]